MKGDRTIPSRHLVTLSSCHDEVAIDLVTTMLQKRGISSIGILESVRAIVVFMPRFLICSLRSKTLCLFPYGHLQRGKPNRPSKEKAKLRWTHVPLAMSEVKNESLSISKIQLV